MTRKELEEYCGNLFNRIQYLERRFSELESSIRKLELFKWSIENPCKYKVGEIIKNCLIINIISENFNYSDNTYTINFFENNKLSKMYLEDFEQYINKKDEKLD